MQPSPISDTVRDPSLRCLICCMHHTVLGCRPMRIAPEVAEALAGGRPVVALESTLISHGLPRPRNLQVAHEVEAAVRAGGAVPATVAVVDGEARIGLDVAALDAIAGGEDVVKCGPRDLAPLAARGAHGA